MTMGSPSAVVYQQRKAEGRCVECGGLMLPEWVGLVRCPECNEENNVRQAAYRRSTKGRKMLRRLHAKRKAKPGRENELKMQAARAREKRLAKKLAGICIDCSEPCLDDSTYCERHRTYHRRLDRERKKLARRGIKKPDGRKRRRPRTTVVRLVPAPKTKPAREVKHFTADQVAAAIGRFDGVDFAELAEALGCPDTDSPAYVALIQHVARLYKAGRIERDGVRNRYSYRIAVRRAA